MSVGARSKLGRHARNKTLSWVLRDGARAAKLTDVAMPVCATPIKYAAEERRGRPHDDAVPRDIGRYLI